MATRTVNLDPAARPPARRRASAKQGRGRRPLRALIGVAVAIGIWAAITESGAVDTRNVATLGAIVSGAADSWHDLLSSVGATLETWAIGLAFASIAGAVLGLGVGLSRWADAASDVVVRMMRPMPSLALIPIAILIAGLGITMTAGLVAFASFWPVFINARYAVRQIEPRLLDTGKVMGLRHLRLIWHVVVPATAPLIATGIRISAGLAIVVTVSVELVAGTGGLGGYVLIAQQNGATGQMYAGIVAGGMLGWLLNMIFARLARMASPWEAAR